MVSLLGGAFGYPFNYMNGFNGMGNQSGIAMSMMNPFNVGGVINPTLPQPPVQVDFNDMAMMFNLLNSLDEDENSNIIEEFVNLLNGNDVDKDANDDANNEVAVDEEQVNDDVNPFAALFGNNFNPLTGMFPTLFSAPVNNGVAYSLPGEDIAAIQADLAGVLNVGQAQIRDTNSIYDVSQFVVMANEEKAKKEADKPKE